MSNGEQQAPDPLVGQVIAGKYKIAKLLGEGGMGCVYVGEQSMGTAVRKVAVKTLHKHLSHDPQIQARFQREVATVAALEHPNTIQVFDFGKMDDGTLYIVMELVQGRSVADILEKDGPMPPDRVVKVLKQVCGSLEEAHGHTIIHRDLKPDNVVLCERAGQKDWVEVLDFGIAKRSSEHDEKEAKLTQQGMVLGTPPYMSPEQFTGQPLDARSDIYALGVMAYEMLTGELPFSANTAWEWATQHMTAQPKPVEATVRGGSVPPAMRAAIMKSLEKSPAARFGSVTEFIEAFSSGAVTGGQLASDAAVPSGGGPASSSGAGRAKTEMGAPMVAPPGGFGGGPAPGGAYGAPPPVSGGAGGQGGAFVPAGPSHGGRPAAEGGGSKTPLLAAAGGIALLTIIGVGVAVFMSGKKNAVPIAEVTATIATTTDADAGTAAATDPTAPTDSVAPLGGSARVTPTQVTPNANKPKDAGSKTPATVPTPIPTPKPVSPETQKVCDQARLMQQKNLPGAAAKAAECQAKGGRL